MRKMKYLLLFQLCFIILLGNTIYSQTNYSKLQSGEYFFDIDPGVGNGTALSLDSICNTLDTTYAISAAGLSAGFHNLFIRYKNEDGKWGMTEGRTMYIMPVASVITDPLNAMEYFFDTDPGVGSGTAIAVTQGDTIDDVFDFSIAGLTDGFHNLFIRTRTQNKIWSITEGRTIYVIPEPSAITISPINSMEYFFDTDPGVGNGTALAVTQGDTIDNIFDISTSGLGYGTHYLFLRVEDTAGVWSIYEHDTIDIVDCNTFDTLYNSVCDSYVSPSGQYTWTSSGIYYDTNNLMWRVAIVYSQSI